jgi:type I restriction enzyme M protein
MRINIGSIGFIRENGLRGITSPDYVVFYCNSEIQPDFVYHFLRSEAGRHAINQKTKGSVRFRLYYQQLASIEIPVPDDLMIQQNFADACNRLEALRRKVSEASLSVQSCFNVATRSAFLRA